MVNDLTAADVALESGDARLNPMPALPTRQPVPEVSHNLQGQRLGLKGRKTRERVLSAARHMIESSGDAPITLSAVAREASVGMTTLYLYFPDIGDLLLAVLQQVMKLADQAFVHRLRSRWPEDTLNACCLDFLQAHYQFWRQHSRILHMRNNFADGGDFRFLNYRNEMATPLIELLLLQMDQPGETHNVQCVRFATVLLTGLERLATVVTTRMFRLTIETMGLSDEMRYIDELLGAEAELLAVSIRYQRAAVAR